MSWQQYYGKWLRLAVGKSWSFARNVGAIISLLVILTVLKWPAVEAALLTTVGPHVTAIAWDVAFAVLCLLVLVRTFLVPYQMHQEQEQAIKDLTVQRETRFLRQARCDQLADFIDRGESIRRLYAKPGPIPTAEAEVWIKEVRTYLHETFGRARITQWEHEKGLPYLQVPKGMLTEDRKVYKTLSYRLLRLREMLDRLTSSMD